MSCPAAQKVYCGYLLLPPGTLRRSHRMKARYLELLGLAAPPPASAQADPEKNWVDEVDGLPVAFPKDGYQGDYIGDIAASLREAEGDGLIDEPGEGRFRDEAQSVIFKDIEGTLGRIGIHFDVSHKLWAPV